MYKIASWIVFLIFLACFMIVPYMVGLVCRVYIPGWTTPDTVVTWLFGLVVLSAVIIVGSGVYWVTCAMKVLIVDGVEKELERVHKKYTLKKHNQAQQDGQLSNPDCSGGELSRVS